VTLIHHPGSDHQLTAISIDAGHARDIMLMLADTHAILGDLAAGTAPAAARQAAARLRDADSPYTLPGLAAAIGEVVTWLHHARHDAIAHLTPPPGY
jgi:hypothetical protein